MLVSRKGGGESGPVEDRPPRGKSGEIGGGVKGERKHLKNYPNSQEGMGFLASTCSLSQANT